MSRRRRSRWVMPPTDVSVSTISWNIFLSLLPVTLCWCVVRGINLDTAAGRQVRWRLWGPLMCLWLAFLPNTCYLLTEWRHFMNAFVSHPSYYWAMRNNPGTFVACMLYTLCFVLYSLVGVVTFYFSFRPLDRALRLPWFAKVAVFGVCAVGVYLGFTQRLNSWDLLTNTAVAHRVAVEALLRPQVVVVFVLFAILLWVSYEVVDVFLHGLRQRGRTEASVNPLPSSEPVSSGGLPDTCTARAVEQENASRHANRE